MLSGTKNEIFFPSFTKSSKKAHPFRSIEVKKIRKQFNTDKHYFFT